MTLSAKQARFVEEFMRDGNATQAYIRAGYSETGARGNAARLIAKDSIAAAIADRRARVSEQADITQAMVLQGLLKEARGEAGDTSSPARIKAWELLGKARGMFVERKDIRFKRVEDMSEEECIAALGEDNEGARIH